MTSRFALVTMALTPDRLKMAEALTFPSMREYAAHMGLDFVVISKPTFGDGTGGTPDWTRAKALHELFGIYERCLHIEDDVIIWAHAEDVNTLPTGIFYGCDNAAYNPPEVARCWEQAKETWPHEFSGVKTPMKHLFNVGSFLADRSHRRLFAPADPMPCVSHWKGQGLLNARLHKYHMKCEHRPDLFGFSYLWLVGLKPSFLHILWQSGSKEQEIRKFLPLMGGGWRANQVG